MDPRFIAETKAAFPAGGKTLTLGALLGPPPRRRRRYD